MERIEQAKADWRERHLLGVFGEIEYFSLPSEACPMTLPHFIQRFARLWNSPQLKPQV
jgi:hypothetical protein